MTNETTQQRISDRAATQETVRPPGPLLSMVVLVAGHAVKHLYTSGFFVVLPEIRTGLGLSNTALGAISTARNVSGSIANFPAGFVADRYSREWATILAAAMMVVGLATLFMGSVASYLPVVLAAILFGGGTAFWHPPAIAALSQRFPQRRGFVVALHGSGGSIGEALGPIIVGSLLAILAWQTILQAAALPALLTGLVVWVLMRNLRGQTAGSLSMRSYLQSVGRLSQNRVLLVILAINGLYSMIQGAVGTFLPVYLRIDLEHSTVEMGAFLFGAQVAGIASQPLLGLLSDRFGRRAVLLPSMLCLGLGVAAVGLVPDGWPLAVAVIWMGAFQFPLVALFLATAMDLVESQVQATTVSLVFGVGTIFGSVSPALSGFLADTFGVRVVFYYAATVALLAALLLMAGVRGSRTTTAAR